MIHLRSTPKWPVIICGRSATDIRPGRDCLEISVWLGKRLHEIKIQRVTSDRFTTEPNDIRSNQVFYGQPAKLGGPVASWVTCKWNRQVPWSFLTVKSGRGPCRFQWLVGPSYCEYSRVTYDLLGSNIGETYDQHADQLPSNREFGHLLVVSQSQVPREFGVTLALVSQSKYKRCSNSIWVISNCIGY